MENKHEKVKMLDPKEEQKYEQLRKLGQELHVPIPEAFIELEVRDKEGNIIQRHRQRSHSWVRNAYNVLFCDVAAVDYLAVNNLSLKDIGGTARELANYAPTLGDGLTRAGFKVAAGNAYWAIAADDNHGILVGGGTNAESFEDYVLQTPRAEGTGANQFSHAASEAPAISTVGTTKKAEWVRYLNNNSGGDVTVNEVAIVASTRLELDGVDRYILTTRDHLASTVTVPDTGQLKVTYTIQLAYPA